MNRGKRKTLLLKRKAHAGMQENKALASWSTFAQSHNPSVNITSAYSVLNATKPGAGAAQLAHTALTCEHNEHKCSVAWHQHLQLAGASLCERECV